MESHLQALIRHYKRSGKRFTLQRAFKELGLEHNYCSKLIEPINAVAMGEFCNQNHHERNAVILIFNSNFRGICIDATARVAFRPECKIDSL